MALGPQAIIKSQEDTARKMEESIDEMIATSKMRPVHISTNMISSWNYHIFHNILIPKYKNAGWSEVTHTSDQRDGDFITLRA